MIEYELRYKKKLKARWMKKVHVWENPNQCIKNFESEVKGKKKKNKQDREVKSKDKRSIF